MKDLSQLLTLAITAVEAAGEEILDVYHSNDFQTAHKDDNSPLTLADTRSHHKIVDVLDTSGIPVLSEEGKNIDYADRKNWEYLWLVDPLDGTKEFIKRNGEFTVNIALVQDGDPILGVVSVPVTGELYFATAGHGAFLKMNGTVTQLTVRAPVDQKKTGLKVVASRSHMNEETEAFVKKLDNPTLISAGSSLKFMRVATGEADLYPRYIPSMEWDTAAADIIVREVGLQTLAIPGNQPLRYNKENLLNPYFICG